MRNTKRRARLLAKVYEIDPMVCLRMHARAVREANDQRKYGAEMKVSAVIENPDELKRILRHFGRLAEQVP